jgi:DNA (cytosine-5)-methyltransferase 1
MGTGGGNVPMVMSVHQNQCGEVRCGKVANTLNTNSSPTSRNAPLIYAIAAKQIAQSVEENISPPIMANDYKEPNAIAYCIQGNTIERSDEAGANGKGVNEDVSFMLNATDRHAIAYDCRNHAAHKEISGTLQAKENGGQSLNYINPVFSMQGFGDYKPNDVASSLKSRDGKDSTDLIFQEEPAPTLEANYRGKFMSACAVRRLTPLECERLQGFPDGWTEYGHDGKKISDSARYKGLGNSLAIPCVDFIMGRVAGAAT